MRNIRSFVILGSILLILTALPTRAEIVPSPGFLLVMNDLAPISGGGCTGNVTLAYGFLPSQSVQQWEATSLSDCSVDITKALPTTPASWVPVGRVIGDALGKVTISPSVAHGLRSEVQVDYVTGGGLNLCPEYVSHTNTIIGSFVIDNGWLDTYDCTVDHYATGYINAFPNGRITEQIKFRATDGWCNVDVRPTYSGGYNVGKKCGFQNAPAGPFDPAVFLDNVAPGAFRHLRVEG